MKAIVLSAILTSFSSKADKSLSFRGVTPELSSEEKVALMDVQGLNVRLLIEPVDFSNEGKLTVKNEIDAKTPSQRIRAALFALYKHEIESGKVSKDTLFEAYYAAKCEKILDWIKGKLPE